MTEEFQKYVELYRQASEHDTKTLWFKVRTIRDAITAGADRDTLLAECGRESGDSRKQVAKFYAVAMVFEMAEYPPTGIAADYSYWLYEACITDPRVNPDDVTTHHYAYEWLAEIEKREIKRGKKTIHATHTPRTLRRAIRAANGNGASGKREVIYKGEVEITYQSIGSEVYLKQNGSRITFYTPDLITELSSGEHYTLTITRPQSAETASAGESEASAA